MGHFGEAPRFELLSDGTVIARAGTQTNCGGIARIHARLSTVPTPGVIFLTAGAAGASVIWDGNEVPGTQVPAEFRDAVERAVRTVVEESSLPFGVQFELLDALVHRIDGRESKFELAAAWAVSGWLRELSKRFPGWAGIDCESC